MINLSPVRTRSGITVALEIIDGQLDGAVMHNRNGNLDMPFRGRCAEALRQAEELSAEAEHIGYELTGAESLRSVPAAGISATMREIDRQLEVLRVQLPSFFVDKATGPTDWSPARLAMLPPIAQQIERLMQLKRTHCSPPH